MSQEVAREYLFYAPSSVAGERFDSALAKILGISRTKAAYMIGQKDAYCERFTPKLSTKIEEGDVIHVIQRPSVPRHTTHKTLPILYEDDDVIVIDKPAGMAAHSSEGWDGPTVLESLKEEGVHITSLGAEGREGIVSRLDVGTSGAMLVCKSDLAYAVMRREFAQHEVEKIYHAVVQGHLKNRKATIEAPIGRDTIHDFRFTVTASGKEAVTHYDVAKEFPTATLVVIRLETGRTHQIRVHFSSIGHPLVGDLMYGANTEEAHKLHLHRQWLHSTSLGFRHPRTKIWVEVHSNYPSDLEEALDLLEKGE